MAIQFKRREKLVAVFLVTTVLIIVGTFALIGKFNNWFSDKNIYYTEFRAIGGLKRGSPVIFRDNEVDIGTVIDWEFNKTNNRITVVFEIFKKYEDKIRHDTIAYLQKEGFGGLAGSTIIQLSIGTHKEIIQNKQSITSYDSYEGKVLLADAKIKVGNDLLANMTTLSANLGILTSPGGPLMQTIHNIEGITRQVKEGDGIPKAMKMIEAIDVAVRQSLEDVNRITNNIDKLIASNVTRVDELVKNLTAQLNLIIVQFAKATDTLLKKVLDQSDPILEDTRKAITRSLKDLTSAISAIAGSAENNVTASLKDVRLIVQNIKTLTTRLNNIMDRVENLPLLGDKPKKKSTLIDEANRENY